MPAFEMYKEAYVALRAEICQSIDKQHHITLGGYGLSAAIFGYILGMDNARWEILIIIPFVLLAMTSLWTVECNRMVRAGYYIGCFLWPALKEAANVTSEINWETWIRSEKQHANEFCRIQHHLQFFVVVFVPLVASLIALGIATYVLWAAAPVLVVLFVLVCLGLWSYVIVAFLKVSNLRAFTYDREEYPAPTEQKGKPNINMDTDQ